MKDENGKRNVVGAKLRLGFDGEFPTVSWCKIRKSWVDVRFGMQVTNRLCIYIGLNLGRIVRKL